MRAVRAALAVVALLAGTAAFAIAGGGPARAATAYRYWSFYVASGGAWQYSQRGPATEYPVDGDVQGWRFAVAADSGGVAPRATPAFATLCGQTAASSGHLRVGIVLDFGTPADAPPGERPPHGVVTGCVSVPDGATGAQVLTAAVGNGNFRVGTGADAGMICGIEGYPRTECAVAVSAAPSAATAAPQPPTAAAARSSPTQLPTSRASELPPSSSAAPSAASASQAPATSSAPAAASTPGSASAPPVSSASSETLSAVRHGSAGKSFPVGAVVGALLVVGIGGAAAARVAAQSRAGRR